jgi:HEPN pEK499 p136
VTFLVNSLLGLIVVPRQTLLDELRQLPVTRTGIPGWGATFDIAGEPAPADLRTLVKGLRNAVAHFSLSFTTAAREITGVNFQTFEDERATIPRWAASFKVDELRSFLDHLADEVDSAWQRRHRREQAALWQ